MMGNRLLSLSFFVGFAASACLGQNLFKCEAFTPVPAVVAEGSAEGKAGADFLKGTFPGMKIPPLSASLMGKVRINQRDVLSRYPNADKLALRQYELYLTCQALNLDAKLSTGQRIRYIQAVGEGLSVTGPLLKRQIATAKTQKSDANSPGPTSSPSLPSAQPSKQADSPPATTQILPNCTGNCAQNNYGNQIQQYGAPRPVPQARASVSPLPKTVPGQQASPPWTQANYFSPGVALAVGATDVFQSAKFLITCNRPCTPGQARIVKGGGARISNEIDYDFAVFDATTNKFILRINDPANLSPSQSVLLQVFSRDAEPIEITSVQSYTE